MGSNPVGVTNENLKRTQFSVSFRFFLCKNFNQVWQTKGIEKNVVLCYNKIEIDTLEQIYAVSYIFIFVSDYNNIFYCS